MPKKYDEQPDLNLLAAWLAKPERGLSTARFTDRETKTGKTPDFRMLRGKDLVAFCEVKSPNDPWLDEQLEGASALTIVGGCRNDPTFNRLARLVNKADRQFAAVNPNREALNTRSRP
jgi:hypothetical protein